MQMLTEDQLRDMEVQNNSDMVHCYNRTSLPVEWLWNSRVNMIPVGGQKIVSRPSFLAGYSALALRRNEFNGLVETSRIGATELDGTVTEWPISLISEKQIEKIGKDMAESRTRSDVFIGKKLVPMDVS